MEKQISIYDHLNELAQLGGVVILGGEQDRGLPLCELKQAFELKEALYNRSMTGLSVENGAAIYERSVAPLEPEVLFIHIGEADKDLFEQKPSYFDHKLRLLLQHIKAVDASCQIGLISLRPKGDPIFSSMNKHLSVIAQTEQCEFCDIPEANVWNPRHTKDVLSFVYSTGFVRSLNRKRPMYDLAKLLFGCM